MQDGVTRGAYYDPAANMSRMLQAGHLPELNQFYRNPQLFQQRPVYERRTFTMPDLAADDPRRDYAKRELENMAAEFKAVRRALPVVFSRNCEEPDGSIITDHIEERTPQEELKRMVTFDDYLTKVHADQRRKLSGKHSHHKRKRKDTDPALLPDSAISDWKSHLVSSVQPSTFHPRCWLAVKQPAKPVPVPQRTSGLIARTSPDLRTICPPGYPAAYPSSIDYAAYVAAYARSVPKPQPAPLIREQAEQQQQFYYLDPARLETVKPYLQMQAQAQQFGYMQHGNGYMCLPQLQVPLDHAAAGKP